MLRSRRTLALPLVLASLVLSARASATDCHPPGGLSTCVDSDNLWVHPGAGPFFSIGSATTTPTDRVSFGLVVSYLSRPIGLRVASPDPSGTVIHAVDDAVNATFLWTLGITDRLELTTAAPVTLYQTGAGLADIQGSKDQLSRSAIRDVRFGLTLALLPRPRIGEPVGTALTARLEFAIPTGDTSAFGGSGTVTAVPSLVLDHRTGRLELAAELGARIRHGYELAGSRLGTQLAGALGASFDVVQKRQLLTVGAEAFALYTLPQTLETGPAAGQPSARVIPAEWIATARSAPFLAGDLSLVLGGGGAIPMTSDSSVTTPRFRFDAGVRYAPLGRDRDGDGVLDRDDKCPTQPEDHDGFEDQDGCPDPDNDGDGIPDERDRCRDEPEDFDGFEDADGCPDPDDDHDGVPDASDKCRNEAEDIDGFQDTDGCPDPDNDGDGIPDVRDRCPNQPEDKDGFQDADGCPDPDNDGDGILDAVDQCPNEPEDRDGFQDADGCPDPDNDGDGVPDAKDACPAAAETINGVADDDGCPEPGAHSLVSWESDRVAFEKPHRFARGKAELSKELEGDLKMAAVLARTRAPIASIIIEAYGDRAGDESKTSIMLAAKRADALKSALVAAGLPASEITAAAGDLSAKRSATAPAFEITVRGRASRGTTAVPPRGGK